MFERKTTKAKEAFVHNGNISFSLNQAKNTFKTQIESGLLFEELLPIHKINAKAPYANRRNRFFSLEIVVRGFLLQAINADKTCSAAVNNTITFFEKNINKSPSSNTAAYSNARKKFPEELLPLLSKDEAMEMEEKIPLEWLWRGKNVYLVDGTTVSMPDTKMNQKIYPQANTQKKGVGFPIARLVAFISYATGALLDAKMGAYSGKNSGEHALLRQLFYLLKPNDVLLGDRYYGSFFLLSTLKKLNVDAIFPMHQKRSCDFNEGEKLGDHDHIVKWKKPRKPEWMSTEEYIQIPNFIFVREIKIQNNRAGFRSKPRIFVTTFLNASDITKKDLNDLYNYRWFVEIDLRSIKETMKMDLLRAKSPSMIYKEVWAHFFGYNLIRKTMVHAAKRCNKKPRQLSFKFTMQIIFAFETGHLDGKQYEVLLEKVMTTRVGYRPNRHEPRKIKRRPKKNNFMTKPRSEYHSEV